MEFGNNTGPYIETVRSLHQTVVALRSALEESKKEILELRTKAWPIDSIQQSLTALAIENHVLRNKLVQTNIPTVTTESTQVEDPIPLESDKSIKQKKYFSNDQPNTEKNEESIPTEEEIIDESKKSIETNQEALHSLSERPQATTAKTVSFSLNEVLQKDKEVVEQTDRKDHLNILVTENVCSDIKCDISPENSRDLKTLDISIEADGSKDILNSKQTDYYSNKAKKQNSSHTKKNRNKTPTFNIHKHKVRTSICIRAKTIHEKKSRSLESLTVVKTPCNKKLSLLKKTSFFDLRSEISCEISGNHLINMTDNKKENISKNNIEDNQSSSKIENFQNEAEPDQEVDDIELIFTTDDTKESEFKEQLVSIDSIEGLNDKSGMKLLAPDLNQSLDISDRELDDDVFDTSFDHDNMLHLKRDNSQLYNSKSDNSINQEERSLRSYYSYQDSSFENRSLEKDESFDRFEERIRIVETDISKVGIQELEYAGIRRNTCPNPLQYRPLSHREAVNKGLNIKKGRPILAHSNAIRKESGAQTDISALPGSSWRSESSLANKGHLGEKFTTLPSKFPLPGSRLKLSEKTTVEARRVLLSDIGFTSMVPELSRSADHLCPSNLKPPQTYGQFLRTPELYSPAYTSQRFIWTNTTATPSEGSHSHSRYSINPLSPPATARRCSAPVSPLRKTTMKSAPSRVRFANGSLPELRGDWTQLTADSGDSTDSLVDEAENYLRRSIDCILGDRERSGDAKRPPILRRASAPVSNSDNIPPQGWQPFLPRQPRDLKLDHWVKVITTEGKVKGGRVRYIGPVAGQTEQFVGVQFAEPEGHSDGVYGTRRYFQCEPFHGVFVPFKKVIMGWRP